MYILAWIFSIEDKSLLVVIVGMYSNKPRCWRISVNWGLWKAVFETRFSNLQTVLKEEVGLTSCNPAGTGAAAAVWGEALSLAGPKDAGGAPFRFLAPFSEASVVAFDLPRVAFWHQCHWVAVSLYEWETPKQAHNDCMIPDESYNTEEPWSQAGSSQEHNLHFQSICDYSTDLMECEEGVDIPLPSTLLKEGLSLLGPHLLVSSLEIQNHLFWFLMTPSLNSLCDDEVLLVSRNYSSLPLGTLKLRSGLLT